MYTSQYSLERKSRLTGTVVAAECKRVLEGLATVLT
jgi:hypothetical protein